MIRPKFEIILYVADQKKSCDFYSAILKKQPILNVPGMTEFLLTPYCKLGIMPENNIAKILLDKLPHPNTGNGIPRCELYLLTTHMEADFNLALNAGAKEVSKIQHRNWGDIVGYVSDFDGHIIAFATPVEDAV